MITSEQLIGVLRWLTKVRARLLWMLTIPALFCLVAYWQMERIIPWLTQPLQGIPLYFATPVEGFTTKFKAALFCGCILALPFLSYMLSSLFSDRMVGKTKFLVYGVVIPFGLVSFAGGTIFGYVLIIPSTFRFLLNTGNEFMKPMLLGSNYISFIMFLLIAIGIVFELPLILVTLSRVGIVSSRLLRDKRKIAIMLIIIVLAVVTPTPDAVTLLLISLPMILLYEISIWWIYLLERKDAQSKA